MHINIVIVSTWKYTVVVTYEIHQIHLTYCGDSTYINNIVIGTWKYTGCSQHVSDQCMTTVHITDVSTWGLYSMLVAYFRLVHEIVHVTDVVHGDFTVCL